jgi:MFS family permease
LSRIPPEPEPGDGATQAVPASPSASGGAGPGPDQDATHAASSAPAGGAPVPPSPLRRPEFRRLLAISITVALGFGLVVPVLPLYAKSFGVGLGAVGLVQFVFGLTRFSFGIVGGLVVDRFGDRASTMAGLLIVSGSSILAGLAQSFPQLVIARGVGGVGSAFFINGLMARILRIIEPSAMGRASGAFRSSFLVGIAAGPVLGGIVAARFGLAAPFLIYGFGLVIATVVTWFVMAGGPARAVAERKSPIQALRAARPLFSDVRFMTALLATFAGWWAISGPAQIVGVVYAEEVLNLSRSQIGIALTAMSIGELLIMIVAGRAADRYGRRAVLVPSLIALTAGVGLLGQIESVPWAIYPLLLVIGCGIAAGGVAAGGLLADSIPREGSGAAIGVNQMAGDLGYLISPTAIGSLAESASYGTAYLVAAVPVAAVTAVALRLPGRARGSTVQPSEPLEPATPVA